MTDERRIALVRDYDGLMAAIRARVAERGMSCEVIDELSGLAKGYSGKVLGPSQVKSLGRLSLGPMLQVLGLALVVIEDFETTQRMAHRYTRRDDKRANTGQVRKQFSAELREKIAREQAREWGRAGAMLNPRSMAPAKAFRRARKAAKSRWKGHQVPRGVRKALERKAERERLRRQRRKMLNEQQAQGDRNGDQNQNSARKERDSEGLHI